MMKQPQLSKPNLRGFFKVYGRIILALLGITLALMIVMAVFSRASDNSTATTKSTATWMDAEDQAPLEHWDLTEQDFDNIVYKLKSTVYYPNQLLMPDEIDGHTPEPVPEGNPVADYLTQRYVVKVPANGQAYKIWIRELQWSVRAYVNGELAGERGNVADNSEDMRISRKPLVVYAAPDENGVIDLVIQTASFRHHEDKARAMDAFFSLASADYAVSVRSAGRSFDPVLIGMFLGFGLLTLALFFTRPRNTENLWFALCCFIMAMRSGVEGGRFTEALPFISEDFIYYMNYIGETAMLFLLMLYFSKVLPKVIPKIILWLVGGATAVVLGVIAFTEPAFFTLVENTYRDYATPLIFIAFLVPLILRFRKPLPEQVISLFGIALFMFGRIFDILRAKHYINFSYTSPYSATEMFTVVFVLTQLVALFMSNYRTTAAAQEAERRIAAEKEAVEQVNRLKTEFLANISHELKTPLTVMSGHAQHGQKALREIPEAEEVERGMRLIASEADRLALMVGQVLDVSQIDEGRMKLGLREASVMEVIQSAMSTYYPLFSKNHNTLRVEPASLPPVKCDAARISQVLVNLVSNAVRHTRDGSITITATQENDMVRINVTDTGAGIPPEEMTGLFERYRTKKAPGDTGTGLGLYISKYIVEAHGGELTIESEPGKGTVASFTLPLARN